MSITKADIVERIYKEAGLSKKDAASLVDLVFDTIKSTLSKGESVKIAGFGSFSIKDKTSRMGRNPQTGEAMEITERRVVTYKSSNTLKEDITARYAHRIDENGNEDKTVEAKPGSLRVSSSFIEKEQDDQAEDESW